MSNVLAYHETLPLAWTPTQLRELPASVAEQNVRVLAAVATLAERPRAEADLPSAAEFERLHQKFDLMIELLGAMLRSTQGLPEAQALQLSSAGLAWRAADPRPTVGALVEARVYLHPCAPAPLRWLGEITLSSSERIELIWRPMPEALLSALEQHVFIRHRRSVADARSPVRRNNS